MCRGDGLPCSRSERSRFAERTPSMGGLIRGRASLLINMRFRPSKDVVNVTWRWSVPVSVTNAL